MAMRSDIFSESNPLRTNFTYASAALMSVDHRFREDGWVGSWSDWDGIPQRVARESQRNTGVVGFGALSKRDDASSCHGSKDGDGSEDVVNRVPAALICFGWGVG